MATARENAEALYLEGIRDGDYVNAINSYSGDRYTQHSTPVKDGRDGFIEFFAEFVDRNPVRDIQILRSFQDGQYVFVNALQVLNDGEYLYVTADIFDSDAHGNLIEHWDIIEEIDAAGVDDFRSGPSQPSDQGSTDANKAAVAALVEAGDDYTQIHRLIGSGNLVAVLAEKQIAGVSSAVIDLFQLEEDEIVKTWAVTEPITPADTWVNSGKF